MKFRHTLLVLSLVAVISACGSSTTSDSTAPEAATEIKPTETSQAPKSNTDFCKNAALATASMESVFSEENTSSSPKETWTEILSYASKMLQNAPDEIEKEARRLQKGISDYEAVLAKYNYDFTAMAADPEATAAVEAIDKDDSMTKASEAVDTYLEEKCGIPQGS